MFLLFFHCWHFCLSVRTFFSIFTRKRLSILNCLQTLRKWQRYNQSEKCLIPPANELACVLEQLRYAQILKYLCIYPSRPDLGKATKLWVMPQSQNCPMESVSRVELPWVPGSAWSRHFEPAFVAQAPIPASCTWMTGIWISRTFWSFRVFLKVSRPTLNLEQPSSF